MKRNAALVMAMTIAMMMAMLTAVAASSHVHVDCDDGDTIEDAIDAADIGDTITVSGTCEEQVDVDKDDLTLVADGATIESGVGGGQSVVTLSADGVTVDGFTVQATNNGASPFEFRIEGDGATVTSNVIPRQQQGGNTPSPGNPAILILGAGATVSANDITDGSIGGGGNVGTLKVTDNTFAGEVPTEGFWLVNEDGGHLTISGNDMSGLTTSTNAGFNPDINLHHNPDSINGQELEGEDAATRLVCDNDIDTARVQGEDADSCPIAQSKDDCKRGGWANHTDDELNEFRNQGQCVSFVASDGKSQGNPQGGPRR